MTVVVEELHEQLAKRLGVGALGHLGNVLQVSDIVTLAHHSRSYIGGQGLEVRDNTLDLKKINDHEDVSVGGDRADRGVTDVEGLGPRLEGHDHRHHPAVTLGVHRQHLGVTKSLQAQGGYSPSPIRFCKAALPENSE